MTRSRILTLLMAVAVWAAPTVLAAQSGGDEGGATRWRRWAGAAAGALVLGGVASFTDQAGEQARTGVCDTTGCVIAIGSLLGAGLGYLLGSELDGRADRRAREGPTLELPLSAVELAESPTVLMGSERGVFALARERTLLVDDSLRARTVLEGFTARASAMGLGGDLLLLASSTEIVGVPMPDPTTDPVPVSETGAAGLESLGERWLAVSEPGRIRLMEVSGSRLAPTLLEGETVATAGLPAALHLEPAGNVLWTLEDSSLVSRRATTLKEVGRLELGGRPVALTLAGPLATLALGDQGAALVDISDPRSPSLRTRLGGMDFAYDAAPLDGRLYVAAGAQGVFVFDLTGTDGEAPPKVGVVRDPDFAGDLLVRDGRLYILDRSAGRLYRL